MLTAASKREQAIGSSWAILLATPLHELQGCLLAANVWQATGDDDFHGTVDGNVGDSGVAIDPAVGTQLSLFFGSDFLELDPWVCFQPWLRESVGNFWHPGSGLLRRFSSRNRPHQNPDTQQNDDATQDQKADDKEKRIRISIPGLVFDLHFATASANLGSFSGMTARDPRIVRKTANQTPPRPRNAVGASQL